MQNLNYRLIKKQGGAVLIVALVLLLVLTVLGTAGIQDTTMEERMAGNYRDHSAAMAAAETALRIGEESVATTSVFRVMQFDGTDGTYEVMVSSRSVDPFAVTNTRSVDPAVLTYSGSLLVGAVPDFYVEMLPEIELPLGNQVVGFQDVNPRVRFYRVTGIGTGVTPNSEVILQSTYFR